MGRYKQEFSKIRFMCYTAGPIGHDQAPGGLQAHEP